ncbi:unnamed protein product [Caenorhabditis brenneri]
MDDMGENLSLTVFYIDDSGQTQGPYPAPTILTWIKTGYFTDNHVMRITDNGQHVGNKVTLLKTLGELKTMYGDEKPIPTSIEEVGVCSFSLKPLSNRKTTNGLKPLKATAGNSKTEKKLLEEDETFSVTGPDDQNRTLPTPRCKQVAGPELPKSMKRKRSRSASSYDSNASESGQKKKKLVSEKKKRSNKKQKEVALPFYTGDKDKRNKRLEKVVAIELATFLSREYVNLTKKAREELHKIYAAFKLPEHCKYCHCPLQQPTNYISHVLSAGHINKSVESGNRRFTFSSDYLLLKNDMERAKKEPLLNVGKPPMPNSPLRSSSPNPSRLPSRSSKTNYPNKCASRSTSPNPSRLPSRSSKTNYPDKCTQS